MFSCSILSQIIKRSAMLVTLRWITLILLKITIPFHSCNHQSKNTVSLIISQLKQFRKCDLKKNENQQLLFEYPAFENYERFI